MAMKRRQSRETYERFGVDRVKATSHGWMGLDTARAAYSTTVGNANFRSPRLSKARSLGQREPTASLAADRVLDEVRVTAQEPEPC